MSDQRERGCEQRRSADPLYASRDVERGDVPGNPAQQRGAGEDDDSEDEQEPPAESVGESSSSQDQRRERERVGVDDPLEPGQVGGEPTLDARQRDVHDRDVEQQHERRRADGDERPPAALGVGLHRPRS